MIHHFFYFLNYYILIGDIRDGFQNRGSQLLQLLHENVDVVGSTIFSGRGLQPFVLNIF